MAFCLPAIDLRGGKCVRLTKGDFDAETVYADDPMEMAKRWQDEGAQRLHVVDLDGARAGSPQHLASVEGIVKATGLPVHYGGGMRSVAAASSAIDAGASLVIVGTTALKAPETFQEMLALGPEKFLVSLDVRGGKLATAGWLKEEESVALETVAETMGTLAIAGLIVTTIDRDGTLQGIDPAPGLSAAKASGLPTILAGGVVTIMDVDRAWSLRHQGIAGLVLGRALYVETLSLKEALETTGER